MIKKNFRLFGFSTFCFFIFSTKFAFAFCLSPEISKQILSKFINDKTLVVYKENHDLPEEKIIPESEKEETYLVLEEPNYVISFKKVSIAIDFSFLNKDETLKNETSKDIVELVCNFNVSEIDNKNIIFKKKFTDEKIDPNHKNAKF